MICTKNIPTLRKRTERFQLYINEIEAKLKSVDSEIENLIKQKKLLANRLTYVKKYLYLDGEIGESVSDAKDADVNNMEAFKNYLIGEELSDSTISSYLYSMSKYFSEYDEITKENIIEWKENLIKKNCAKTVNLRLNAIRKYMKFQDISFNIKSFKVQTKSCIENVITIKQYNKLISSLEKDGNYKWIAYIKLLAKTGARISEALSFTKKDLDLGYREMNTKGKTRRIYFSDSLKKEINKFYKDYDSDSLLIQNTYGEKMTVRGFETMLWRFAARYNIPKNNMHPHSFRHLFAIEFLKRNKNISLLADLLGHSGVNTTMIYLRLSQEEQKRALNKATNWENKNKAAT